jgi:hypothetical protein
VVCTHAYGHHRSCSKLITLALYFKSCNLWSQGCNYAPNPQPSDHKHWHVAQCLTTTGAYGFPGWSLHKWARKPDLGCYAVSGTFWLLDWSIVACTIWIWTDWIVGCHSWNPLCLLMWMCDPSILWWRTTSSLAFAMLTGSVYVYLSVQYLADVVALVAQLLVMVFLCINMWCTLAVEP